MLALIQPARDDFSSAERLARAMFLGRCDWQNQMAFCAAYFDESGVSHQGDILVVGGAVATIEKWTRLERAWISILSEYGLRSLHMKDVYVNRNEFAGWNRRADEKRELLRRLADCVKQNVNKTFASALVLKSYREVNRSFRIDEEIGNPYPFCALSCVAYVQHWAKNKGMPERNIEFIFEHGAEHRGQFLERCRALMSVSPVLMGKDRLPLQVADFIAWETRRSMVEIHDAAAGKKPHYTPARESHEILTRRAHTGKYMMSRQLVELCALYGVSRRDLKSGA